MEPGDVLISYVLTEACEAGVLAKAAALLSDDERMRRDRFRFDRDRREYTAAHALLRTSLSRVGDLPPGAWRFESGPHGKPAVASGLTDHAAAFNLAHTRGLVCCGVAAAGTVLGVDAECITRPTNWRGIAGRYFAADEADQIEEAAEEARAARFFEIWTLKEAFLKAIGTGLSQPLNTSAFRIGADGAIAFRPPVGIDPSRWSFALHAPTPEHRLAVAVSDGSPRAWRIVTARTRLDCEI